MNRVRISEEKKAGFRPSSRGEKGFTLMELVITMAVLAVVMGAATSAGVGRKTQFNLSVSQEKTRALISRAKGLALNSLISQGSNICGYGVHITYDKAVIFTDRVGAGTCDGSDRRYTPGEELVGGADQVVLDQGIYYSDVSGGGSPSQVRSSFGGPGYMDVLFAPPDPTTYINAISGVNQRAILGVAYSSQNFRKITVEGTGLISVSSY